MRVRGRGDQGLGSTPAQREASPPCTKSDDLVPPSPDVAFLTSPSLCSIRGNPYRALASPFRDSGVGLRWWGDAGPAHTEAQQVGAQGGDHRPPVLPQGQLSPLTPFFGRERCDVLIPLERLCVYMT